MRKLVLLSLGLLIAGFAGAQSVTLKEYLKGRKLQLQPFDRSIAQKGVGDEPIMGYEGANIREEGQAPGSEVIGVTLYDLQTNSAVARRLFYWGDGRLTATWTGSWDNSFSTRGTGYAYYNGSDWTVLDPTVRLESIRTGWPCIGVNNGNEFVMSHDGTNYNLQQVQSNTIGSGDVADWTTSASGASVPTPTNSRGSIWARMTTSGDNVYVVSCFQVAGPDSFAMVSGIKAPTVWAMSNDAAATWAVTNGALPNYDSTRTLYGGADDYDIDANVEGVVAIAKAGLGEDVSVWKSIDNGSSWQHTYVDSFEYAPDYIVAPIDLPLPTNDGSVSIIVDDGGIMHVSYAEGVVVNDAIIGRAFQPGWIGLRYWTEGMDTAISIPILVSDVDADGDGNYVVAALATDVDACRYGNNSILNKPSISGDDNGNIFITFSLPHDADSTFDGQPFRDIFVTMHNVNDPIDVWTTMNVTNTYFVEEAFATAAKKVDSFIYILYQEDFEPGTNLTNGDAISDNNINFIKVANPLFTIGVNEVKQPESFSVNQNYPNPFSSTTAIQLNMKEAAKVSLEITDVLGKVVMKNNYTLGSGIKQINLDRGNLSSGVYTYTVRNGQEQVSHKMIVD